MKLKKIDLLLIFSALAFYVVSAPGKSKSYVVGLFLAFIALVIVFLRFKNLVESAKTKSRFIRAFAAISAIGMCENAVERFVANWSNARLLHRLLGEKIVLALLSFSILCALCSLPFLYTAFCFAANEIKKRLDTFKSDFSALPKYEIAFYAVLLLAFFAYMTVIYGKTYAFYDPEQELGDLIYTSDIRLIARPNAYLSLANAENDLRQPLFAVFSAPFIAAPYALSLVFRAFSPYSSFYFMNYAQIALIVLSIILLSLIASERPLERICFSAALSLSFPYLLFSLVMEQYVIATFYLVLFVYSACKKKGDALFLFGAIGTLATSVIFTPLMLERRESLKKWIKQLFMLGIAFVFTMFFFCRGDTIVRIFTELKLYLRFTGEAIPFSARFMQYTSFASSLFFFPLSEIRYKYLGESNNESWQLSPVTSYNIAGIVIIALCIVSAIINRKKIACRIAAIWILFSFLLLCVLGWGTAENGLVLYTIYFSWAFAILLFSLLPSRIRSVFALLCAVFFLKYNAPELQNLFSFATEVCPR